MACSPGIAERQVSPGGSDERTSATDLGLVTK
jgi:hypothetical protein